MFDPNTGLGRRAFLRRAAAAPLLAGAWVAGDARAEGPGLIVRQQDPENLEMPFDALAGFQTPNELFYVRSHFAVPKLVAAAYKLSVVGAVRKPLEMTLEQALALGQTTMPATLECAGNGRSFLRPEAKGVPWGAGAVGTAEWAGVPLAALLDKAVVQPGAVEVVLEGADSGEVTNEPKPEGKIAFARSLPLEKARSKEVLLASHMNGAALTPAHGFPLRVVVGGWYGMASVKWLRRIVVLDRPFRGYFQSVDYTTWRRGEQGVTLEPITAMEVKASIARPKADEELPAGADVRVHGAAWAGEADVAKVEVSVDGGKSWRAARLLGRPVPLCWRLWEYDWEKPAAGKHKLLARATDSRDRTQPMQHDPDRRNYVITHCQPVEVTVRGG
jgi:DMSO/TMAO reductase YedYZ molybdopterin-dependent catalytic subunit